MLFVLGGLVTLGSLAVGAWPDARRLEIAVTGLIAIVSGAGVLWSGQRISRLTASVMVSAGTLLIALAQLATATVAAAVSYSIIYVFCVIYSVLFLRTVDVVVHLALIVAAQTFVLTSLGTSTPGGGQGLAAHIVVNVTASAGIATVLAQQLRRRRAAERVVVSQSRLDALTGLASRHALLEHVNKVMRTPAPAALLLLDVESFRDINDTFGVEVGDQLLQTVARRLRPVVRDDDVLARIGGDEFGVLLNAGSGANIRHSAEVAAERVQAALRDPIEIDGVALSIEARVGVALAVEGSSAEDLLRQADLAAERARTNTRAIATVSHVPPRRSPDHLALLAEVRMALEGQAGEADAFVPYFQPVVDIASRRIVGAEALVRWRHPVRGLVAPGAFLPLVERTTMMRELTAHMLGSALQTCATWHREGMPLTVAVNVSARDLGDPGLVDVVAGEIARTGVPGSALVIEITETALMNDLAQASDVITQLRALGTGVSVDDFGTGWSSLAHLQRLPVTELKIDRSFVAGARTDSGAAKIAAATIGLGQSLGLEVVAEGVEDADTVVWLAGLQCDKAQGWLFGRPMPAADFITLVRDTSAQDPTGDATHTGTGHAAAEKPTPPGEPVTSLTTQWTAPD